MELSFSELFKLSSPHLHFSPSATHIATAVDHRLVIRDADSLQITNLFNCTAAISDIAWSPDSDLILCCSYKRGMIQVWSLRDPEWKASIEEGVAGLRAVRWSADGRCILSFSDFQHFPVDTDDLEDISWSPDGRYLAVWDSILSYKVLIYHPDGRLVKNFSAYPQGLGIKSASWSPSSQFLALGSFDEKVRLLNHYTWTPLVDLAHPTSLPFPDIRVFREVNGREVHDVSTAGVWAQLAERKQKIIYEEVKPPVQIQTTKPDMDKVNPKRGVGVSEFSCDGRFLATRNDNMPNTLWIWDILNLSQVALVQQLSPIKYVRWNPVQPDLLAFTCENSHVYLWGGPDKGCEAVEVPAQQFTIAMFRWSPDGRSFALMDKDKFCVAFIMEDGEEAEKHEDLHGGQARGEGGHER